MTDTTTINRRKHISFHFGTTLCIVIAILIIAFGNEMRSGIYEGLVFSFTTILPTLFPFFILSDIWSAVFKVKTDGLLARTFECCFSIAGCGISAFISGLICGFPIGVKIAVRLYENGKISKSELQRLCGFVNNPSVAFVISGVGVGILGSLRVGALLYISLIISSLAIGIIFRDKKEFSHKTHDNIGQSINIAGSIISAGTSSLTIVSCIAAFSGVMSVISSLIQNDMILSLIYPFLEVSNASKMIGEAIRIPYDIRLSLIAFSLGFSGMSVHLQAFSFLPKELSKSKYLFMKMLQGIIASLLVYISAKIIQ